MKLRLLSQVSPVQRASFPCDFVTTMYFNPAADCSKLYEIQMEESLVLSSQHPDHLWCEQAQSICLHYTVLGTLPSSISSPLCWPH